MVWKPDYIELEAYKSWARVDDDDDDAELANDIAAASRAVDDSCNRQFGRFDTPVTFTYTAWYHPEDCRWVIDIHDLMSISGLVVSIPTIGPTTDYDLAPENALAEGKPYTKIVFRKTGVLPVRSDGYKARATERFGWLAFPPPVVFATRLQTSRFAARRDSPYGVVGSPDAGTELRLQARVDPDVAVSLKGYRRPRAVG